MKWIEKTVSSWETEEIIPPEDREIYVYGLDLIFSTLVSVLGVCAAGFIFGYLPATLVYLAVLLPMQALGGGYHADTHLRCFLLMVSIWWIVVPHVSVMPEGIAIGLTIVSSAGMFALMPVPNANVPMSEGYRRKLRKIARILCGFLTVHDKSGTKD